MGINKRHKNKIIISNIDEWLASLGYLYSINRLQQERFDKLYADYDFKLKDAKVNVQSIINGTYKPQIRLFKQNNEVLEKEIDDLKMVARKGHDNLPEHIKEKIIKNHKDNKSNE